MRGLEPFVPRFNQLRADSLWLNGQTDAAIALETTSATRPNRLAMMYASAGRYREAVETLLTIPPQTLRPGELESAVRLLRTAPRTDSAPQSLPSVGALSFVYVFVGAPERVLDYFDSIPFFVWHAAYAPVRKTERFKELVHSAGVLDYWRAKGWPDLCRPVGADDFECE